MQERPVMPQYNPQRLPRRPHSLPPTQQLAVQLVLPQAQQLLSLPTVTPIDRPLVTKELASHAARKTTLQGTAQQRQKRMRFC